MRSVMLYAMLSVTRVENQFVKVFWIKSILDQFTEKVNLEIWQKKKITQIHFQRFE